jgi:sigma-70-like protein
MELRHRRRLLTSAEEIRLAKRIERGDLRAKDEMVERSLPLVFSAARRYRGRGMPFDDLVQEGTVGRARLGLERERRHRSPRSAAGAHSAWLDRGAPCRAPPPRTRRPTRRARRTPAAPSAPSSPHGLDP